MADLATALQVAIRVHARQKDRQNEPYLFHVLRVVEAVSDEAKVVAALHDVIEDGTLELHDLVIPCGLSGVEAHALNLVSRPRDMSYAYYIDEIAANARSCPLAREVKLADLRDNLGRIPPEPVRAVPRGLWRGDWLSLKRRYEEAIATLSSVGEEK